MIRLERRCLRTFPDALALKGDLASEDGEIAQRRREIARRDARTAIKTAHYAYAFTNAAITINRESQELLEQMITVAQAKIRVDRGSYNAVIMAQVELAKLSDGIITLEQQRETVIARINTLLNRSPEASLGPPRLAPDVELGLPLKDVYEVAIRDRQELQQQQLRIGRMNTMIELAARMAYPDPTAGASYFEDRLRPSVGTDQATSAFMTRRDLNHRETPWFGQRDAYIRELKTKAGAMGKTLTAMQDKGLLEFVGDGLGGKWLKVNNDDRLKASVDNPNGRDKSIFLFSASLLLIVSPESTPTAVIL